MKLPHDSSLHSDPGWFQWICFGRVVSSCDSCLTVLALERRSYSKLLWNGVLRNKSADMLSVNKTRVNVKKAEYDPLLKGFIVEADHNRIELRAFLLISCNSPTPTDSHSSQSRGGCVGKKYDKRCACDQSIQG